MLMGVLIFLLRSLLPPYSFIFSYIRVFDFEFYIANTAGERLDMLWYPVFFAFSGPDVRPGEILYLEDNRKTRLRIERDGGRGED